MEFFLVDYKLCVTSFGGTQLKRNLIWGYSNNKNGLAPDESISRPPRNWLTQQATSHIQYFRVADPRRSAGRSGLPTVTQLLLASDEGGKVLPGRPRLRGYAVRNAQTYRKWTGPHWALIIPRDKDLLLLS
jgi:hypothetical protein